jgi:hypothetical protein
MCQKKLELTAQNVKPIKFTLFPSIRRESVGLWLRVSVIMSGKRRVMVGKSILFRESFQKLLKSKL